MTSTELTEAPPTAFEQVYRDHAARVFRYCLSQVSNRGDAEDLAADVFAAAFHAFAHDGGRLLCRDEEHVALR